MQVLCGLTCLLLCCQRPTGSWLMVRVGSGGDVWRDYSAALCSSNGQGRIFVHWWRGQGRVDSCGLPLPTGVLLACRGVLPSLPTWWCTNSWSVRTNLRGGSPYRLPTGLVTMETEVRRDLHKTHTGLAGTLTHSHRTHAVVKHQQSVCSHCGQ